MGVGQAGRLLVSRENVLIAVATIRLMIISEKLNFNLQQIAGL